MYVERKSLGVVRDEPFIMRMGQGLQARSPDVLFLKTENFGYRRENHLAGPADLAIEIISKGSEQIDRVDKRQEYEQGGVAEYWLIDPFNNTATFFLRGDDGIYASASLDEQGRSHSPALPGFWIDPDWLWRKPLPNVWDTIVSWGWI